MQRFLRIAQKWIYLIVIVGLLIFVYSLGAEPWHHVLDSWQVFFCVVIINFIGIVVQAASFREVQPEHSFRVPWADLIRIWSFSGIVSVIAPIVAGLATRTTLLVRAGMPLSTSITTSIRQIWVGLEHAFIIGGIAAYFVELPNLGLLGTGLVLAGMLMISTRVYSSFFYTRSNYWRSLESLRSPVTNRAHPWFMMQIIAMSAIYYITYNGLGAKIIYQEALLLSTVTILTSLVVFIPNGLGIIDTVWVIVGTHAGLDIRESVALVIIIRLAYLTAAISAWVLFTLINEIIGGSGE